MAPNDMPAAEESLLQRPRDGCAFVIFGASGDLTSRKLVPALYNLSCQDLLPPGFAVVGFAMTPMTDAGFRHQMEQSVKHSPDVLAFRQKLWDEFVPSLHYITADFDSPEGYQALAARLSELDAERGCSGNRLFYLATPPSFFPTIVDNLHRHGLAGRGSPSSRLDARRHREAIRARPGQRPGAQRDDRAGAGRGTGLSDRSLSREGHRPEHPRLSLCQLDHRADLESQLRRSRSDHGRRNARRRASRQVLRGSRLPPRHVPESPAAIHGARGDGASGAPPWRVDPRSQGRRAPGHRSRSRRRSCPRSPCAASTGKGRSTASPCPAIVTRAASLRDSAPRPSPR